jgi:hypothetical protein
MSLSESASTPHHEGPVAVRAGFDHLAPHLVHGALVAFDDHTSGVQRLVDELILERFEHADSLIFLRR